MTYFTDHPRPAALRVAGRAFAAVAAGWNRFRRERELRATVETLHRLDDHLLRDIGLRRGDIEAGVRRLARCR